MNAAWHSSAEPATSNVATLGTEDGMPTIIERTR